MNEFVLIGESGLFGAKIQEGIIQGAVIEGGISGNNTNSTTKISEYGNLEDIKSIHQNRFYDKLINNMKKIENDKIYFNRGKIYPYPSQEKIVNEENKNNRPYKADKFAIMGNTYLWLNTDNILQDISLISNITDEINVLGYIIKRATYNSPQVIKTLAMYIE